MVQQQTHKKPMLKPTPSKPGLFSVAFKRFSRLRGIAVVALMTVTLSVLYLSFVTPPKAYATTSNTLNFQARLESSSGAIAPDGTYNIEFKLYSVSSGGSAEWTEDYLVNASQGVKVANGYLTVNLGSITPFSSASTPITWGSPQYLTMNIGSTTSCTPFSSCSPDGEMSPRLPLTAVPAAFSLESANAGSFTSTLSFVQPTASESILLPAESGATEYVCYQNDATNCGYAPTTLGTGYIQNGTTQQTGANFNIAGAGQLATLDATGSGSANTLTIGAGATYTGSIAIDTSASVTTGTVTIGGANQTGTITVGQTSGGNNTINIGAAAGNTFTQTINIGTSSTAGSKTAVTVGSTIGSSSTLIQAGTGNLQLQTQGGTLGIGNNAVAQTLTIGNTTGATAITIQTGTGALNLQTQGTGGVNIATNGIAQTVTIGNTTGASAITIQGGTGAINIGTQSIADTITIGNTTGASAITMQTGTGALNLNSTTSSTGAITIGNSSAGNVGITTSSTHTITQTAGATSQTIANTGDTIVAAANTIGAFEVQSANGNDIFDVNTTTANLITNSSFAGNFTGWAATGAGASLTLNSNYQNSNDGIYSLQVVTGTSGAGGAQVTSFTSALVPAQYTLSFTAMASGSAFTDLAVTITGGSSPTCTLSSTTVATTGFNRYTCTFTSTTSNITAITIGNNTATSRTFYLDGVDLTATSVAGIYGSQTSLDGSLVIGVGPGPSAALSNNSSLTVLSPRGNNLFDMAFIVQNDAGSSMIAANGYTNSTSIAGGSTFWGTAAATVTSSGGNAARILAVRNDYNTDVIDSTSNTSNLIANPTQIPVIGSTVTGWVAKGASSTLSSDSTNPYIGLASMKAAVTAVSNGMQTSSFNSTPLANTQYQLTFYAECSTADSTFTYGRDDVSGTDVNATTTATCGTTWQQYTWHFTTGATITNPNIFMDTGSGAPTSMSLWVDAVSLVQTTISSATNYDPGNIFLPGVVAGPVTFQNTTNSSTAFQVQNSSSTDIFGINTANSMVNILPGNTGYQGMLASTQTDLGLQVGGAIQQLGFSTTNTSSTYGGQWTELASCTISGQFNGCSTEMNIVGGESGGFDNSTAEVDFQAYQQASPGSNPIVVVSVSNDSNTSYITASDFEAVVTSNTATSGTPTVVALYGKIPNNYESWSYTPIVNDSHGAVLAWTDYSAFTTTLPSGVGATPTTIGSYAELQASAQTSTDVAFSAQAYNGGTGDIMDLINGGGTKVATFGATGNVSLQNSTNSTNAVQVQNATGSRLVNVDTNSSSIMVGGQNPASVITSTLATYEWDGNATNDASLSVTPHTAGDLMIAAFGIPVNGLTITGVSGGGVAAGGWHHVIDEADTSATQFESLWEGTITTTGATTVVPTYSATPGTTTEIVANEFSAGLGSSTLWAVTASSTNAGTTTTINYPSLTSSQGNQLYWGYDECGGIASNGSTSGFTYKQTLEHNEIAYNPSLSADTTYTATAPCATSPESGVAAIISAYTANTSLSVTGNTTVTSSSTTAFNVQSTGGSSLFDVDTTNSTVTMLQSAQVSTFTEAGNVQDYAFTLANNIANPTEEVRWRVNNSGANLESSGVDMWLSGWTSSNFSTGQLYFERGEISNGDLFLGDGELNGGSNSLSGSNGVTLLVLDNTASGTTTDPTAAFPGAMYYNANMNSFRCYNDGEWVNCVSAVRTYVENVELTSGTTSSTSYAQIPGSSTMTITKQANNTNLTINLELSWRDNSASTPVLGFIGLNINGGNTECTRFYFNATVLQTHMPVSCTLQFSPNAGTVTIKPMWATNNTAVPLAVDGNDQLSMTVTESY